jgi:hypothetical protein
VLLLWFFMIYVSGNAGKKHFFLLKEKQSHSIQSTRKIVILVEEGALLEKIFKTKRKSVLDFFQLIHLLRISTIFMDCKDVFRLYRFASWLVFKYFSWEYCCSKIQQQNARVITRTPQSFKTNQGTCVHKWKNIMHDRPPQSLQRTSYGFPLN